MKYLEVSLYNLSFLILTKKRGVFTIYLLMRLSCALLCFFCEKSWSICELPCAFVCFSIYLLYQIPVFIKYRTIKNRIDGQPPRSFISLYVFHRSRLLFSLTACFQADLSHLSFFILPSDVPEIRLPSLPASSPPLQAPALPPG